MLYNTWGYFNGSESNCPTSDTASCFPLGTLAQLTDPSCSASNDWLSKVDTFECMSYAIARGYMSAFTDVTADIDYIAPCGMAWMVARGSNPVPADCKAAIDREYFQPLEHGLDLPLAVPPHSDTTGIMLYLSNGQDKHPTVAGQYLNALVFYATIFQASPLGAAVPPEAGLTADQAKGLQQVAEGVVLGHAEAWGLPFSAGL